MGEFILSGTLEELGAFCLKSDSNQIPVCFNEVESFFWPNEPSSMHKFVDSNWSIMLWTEESHERQLVAITTSTLVAGAVGTYVVAPFVRSFCSRMGEHAADYVARQLMN